MFTDLQGRFNQPFNQQFDQQFGQQSSARSAAFTLYRALLGLMLVTLLTAACQPVQPPVPNTTLSAPTGLRVDAPTYAVHGPQWVGYQSLVINAESDRPLAVSMWYPARNPDGAPEAVVYDLVHKDATWSPETAPVVHGHALLNAALDDAQGPYPLVILSHGFTLSTATYSAMAEHYASYGFIVLAPEHIEQFDYTFGDLWKALIDRPGDVTQTLDYAERLTAADGAMAGMIDMANVAVVGHSYGGYTALAMAGAQYDLNAYNARCAEIAQDDPLFFFCAPVMPMEAEMAERAGLDALPEGLWPSFGDQRVTAIIPMAGDAYLFDQAGLSKITMPVMAMGGSADTGTPLDWGSQLTYDAVASEQKAFVNLVGAEHMIFSTPCENQPWISDHPAYVIFCLDPVWDKDRALDLIHHFSTAFLLDTLKDDADAHATLLPAAVQFPGIEYSTTME